MSSLWWVQYFVGQKRRGASLALSLTQSADVRAAQGLIRGSLVSACLHTAVFSATENGDYSLPAERAACASGR